MVSLVWRPSVQTIHWNRHTIATKAPSLKLLKMTWTFNAEGVNPNFTLLETLRKLDVNGKRLMKTHNSEMKQAGTRSQKRPPSCCLWVRLLPSNSWLTTLRLSKVAFVEQKTIYRWWKLWRFSKLKSGKFMKLKHATLQFYQEELNKFCLAELAFRSPVLSEPCISGNTWATTLKEGNFQPLPNPDSTENCLRLLKIWYCLAQLWSK